MASKSPTKTSGDKKAYSNVDLTSHNPDLESPVPRRKKIWSNLKNRFKSHHRGSPNHNTLSLAPKKAKSQEKWLDLNPDQDSHDGPTSSLDNRLSQDDNSAARVAEPTSLCEKSVDVENNCIIQQSEEQTRLSQQDTHMETAVLDEDITGWSCDCFLLNILLKDGRNLVARDSSGTSDPYVKFKLGTKAVCKSQIVFKNLNPEWNESFNVPLTDLTRPLTAHVIDHDRISDDPMGYTMVDLAQLEFAQETELKLPLLPDKKCKKNEALGEITLVCTLRPMSAEEKNQYFKRTVKDATSSGAKPEAALVKKTQKSQQWNSVVTVVLVDGHGLLPMDDNGFSDPYVKFKLGNEKYKSKIKYKTLDPRWLEQFDLYVYDDVPMTLELVVWDYDQGNKDEFMGRAEIDLQELERDKTHRIEQRLEDGAGSILLLVTISAIPNPPEGSGTPLDSSVTPSERHNIARKYGFIRSFRNLRDLGWLQVKVLRAQGLAAADIGGKSDPFCVLELVNDRAQTFTEYKCLDPVWNKVFTFTVKDIHSILEVTVYDEDKDKKYEFLGKVAIPLMRVRSGERKWFALKDRKVLNRTKGAILLELDFVYNHLKAAIRTFNPREEKYMQPDPKFKVALMKKNIDRVSKIAQGAVETGKFIGSCFSWESKPRSLIAFIVYLVVVWNFELYMLPVTLLIVFLKNLFVAQITGSLMKEKDEEDYFVEDEDDEEDDKDPKDEKKGFRERLQMVQDVCLQVQEAMDMVASLGERVKNASNWTVPWLSTLAVIVLLIVSILLYYVPLRWLLMAWGINKFTKKLRSPHAIDNNELLDYLSRAPSDKETVMYRELRPDSNVLSPKKKRN